jgi:hypothetical protein
VCCQPGAGLGGWHRSVIALTPCVVMQQIYQAGNTGVQPLPPDGAQMRPETYVVRAAALPCMRHCFPCLLLSSMALRGALCNCSSNHMVPQPPCMASTTASATNRPSGAGVEDQLGLVVTVLYLNDKDAPIFLACRAIKVGTLACSRRCLGGTAWPLRHHGCVHGAFLS